MNNASETEDKHDLGHMKFNNILENIFETETINNIKNIYLTLASPIIIHFIQVLIVLK